MELRREIVPNIVHTTVNQEFRIVFDRSQNEHWSDFHLGEYNSFFLTLCGFSISKYNVTIFFIGKMSGRLMMTFFNTERLDDGRFSCIPFHYEVVVHENNESNSDSDTSMTSMSSIAL
jgi:hypothetical protein